MDKKLVRVHWGTDEGLVDLSTGKLICYVRNFAVGEFIIPDEDHSIDIDEDDFKLTLGEDCKEWNWSDVPELLRHPQMQDRFEKKEIVVIKVE
jgi:hypothetical protein